MRASTARGRTRRGDLHLAPRAARRRPHRGLGRRGQQPPRDRTASAPFLMPMEPYAGYQPQTSCRRTPKPGVLMLADWLVARGGGYGPISRSCAGSSTQRAQGVARLRLAPATRPSRRRRARRRPARRGPRARRHRPAARAGAPDGGHVHHLERHDVRLLRRVRAQALPQLRAAAHAAPAPDAAPPRPLHVSLTRQGAKGVTSWYYAQEPSV